MNNLIRIPLMAALGAVLLMAGCPDPGGNGGTPDIPALDPLVELSETETYRVTATVTVNNVDALGLSRISAFIPVPSTNVYQTVSDINLSGADLIQLEDSDCRYARFVKTSDFPAVGESYTCSISYTVTQSHLSADTSGIDTVYPYNTTTLAYIRYRGNRGSNSVKYIDVGNTTIAGIGNALWTESGGNYVLYARLCYEHVAKNYTYQGAYTGIHPLADILSNGGGDCGNLSSIFVTLLRYKNIPARHIMTVRTNGTFHIWSDFYLEGYGWIPVDVNAALNDWAADGDFDNENFGEITRTNNGIIVMNDCWFHIIRYEGDTTGIDTPIFQDCGLSTDKASGTVVKNFTLSAIKL